MENNLNSLDASSILSTTEESEEKKLASLEAGRLVSSMTFFEQIRSFGLRNAVKCHISRWVYIARLWLLRESYIHHVLLSNYEKVPRGTPTKVLLFLPHLLPPLRTLPLKVANMLNKRLIRNPYQVQKTNNKDDNNLSKNDDFGTQLSSSWRNLL